MVMGKKYKKMLEGMVLKGNSKSQIKEKWYLYILRCKDGSFYTGITKDLKRRFKMHNDGKASRYTRTRRPVELLYQEPCQTRTQALVRECEVKSLPREKKEKLIVAEYIQLKLRNLLKSRDLSPMIFKQSISKFPSFN